MRYVLIFLMLLFSSRAWALEIKSNAFQNGSVIPAQYTCDADDISPALSWSDVPSGSASLVLICDDPDSPSKPWSHWVMFNIPPDKTGLPQDVPKIAKLRDGTIQGINDFGKVGYSGPCPPPYGPHRYFFTLYAVDTTLNLDENSTKQEVWEAIKGHIIAEAVIFGTYKR